MKVFKSIRFNQEELDLVNLIISKVRKKVPTNEEVELMVSENLTEVFPFVNFNIKVELSFSSIVSWALYFYKHNQNKNISIYEFENFKFPETDLKGLKTLTPRITFYQDELDFLELEKFELFINSSNPKLRQMVSYLLVNLYINEIQNN